MRFQEGSVYLKDCIFTCNATTLYSGESEPSALTKPQENNESTTEDYNYDDTAESAVVNNEAEIDVGRLIHPFNILTLYFRLLLQLLLLIIIAQIQELS